MCFAPQVGIEPTTFWLTVRRNYRCATAEQNTLFISIFNCNLFFLSSVGRHSGLHCHPNLFSETFDNHSFRQGPPDYFAVLLSKLHVKIEFIIIKAQKDASPSLRLSHDTGISQPSNTLSGTVNPPPDFDYFCFQLHYQKDLNLYLHRLYCSGILPLDDV